MRAMEIKFVVEALQDLMSYCLSLSFSLSDVTKWADVSSEHAHTT